MASKSYTDGRYHFRAGIEEGFLLIKEKCSKNLGVVIVIAVESVRRYRKELK